METRQLNFDVARGGIQHRLFVRSGDANSRTIIAKMYSGSEELDFVSAKIRILHADGTKYEPQCENVVGNTITYTFTTEDIGEGGEVWCEFIIVGAGGAYMTSPRFILVCEPILFDGSGVESTNEYKDYITALDKIYNLSASVVTNDVPSVEVSENEQNGIYLKFALPKGDKGDDGRDGVDGKDGKDGANGKNGVDGYTPQKGVDYFTEADKKELVDSVNAHVDERIGEVENALDTLHEYAVAISGGEG